MNFDEWAADLVPVGAQAAAARLPQQPSLRVKFADSPYTAPGWRELGVEYSCIPDAAYPWDPQVMREVWKYAPDAVPLWVRWAFLSPQETGNPKVTVFGRHGLGRHIDDLHSDLDGFRCEMPDMPCQGVRFKKPNRIWFIHQGKMTRDRNAALPGEYLPFDGTLLDTVRDASTAFRQTAKEFIAAEKERMILSKRRRREEFFRRYWADMADRDRDFGRYAAKMQERISDVEIKEYMGAAGQREPERKPRIVVP